MQFPNQIYVRMGDAQEDLLEAFGKQADAVEDDGPTEVGTYQLIETNVLEKVTKHAPAPQK